MPDEGQVETHGQEGIGDAQGSGVTDPRGEVVDPRLK